MGKVKMQAKTEVESIHNFKILQTAFSKKRVDRYIDVDKLSKRSFQTNMEFLQFMKCYWDMHAPNGGAAEAPLAEAGNTEAPPEKVAKPASEPFTTASCGRWRCSARRTRVRTCHSCRRCST